MDLKAKEIESLAEMLAGCEYLLIGLGDEWEKAGQDEVRKAYESLYNLVGQKDYFIVTTATDARIFDAHFDEKRITAPCGNINWFQCQRACTKDIWERGEIQDGRCPHCGAVLISNTIQAESYIEEGYLPQWKRYQEWLAKTLNRKLLIFELGVGFRTPTVIRWPFEKMVFFNRSAHMYRVNRKFYQIAGEIMERAVPVEGDSLEFVCDLREKIENQGLMC